MKKYICTVCGYIHEGDAPPEVCPICKVGADKFEEVQGEMQWADAVSYTHLRAHETAN